MCWPNFIYSQSDQPPNEGNFALPASQEPGPFYSFGQNIIDKNDLQTYIYPNFTNSPQQHSFAFPVSLLYGITDDSSVLLTVPIATRQSQGPKHSSGIGDSTIQGEYAFYSSSNARYEEELTAVGYFSIPSGSAAKNPPTGFGAWSYFAGGTYNRMWVNWLIFASGGAANVSKHNNDQLGTQYIYQGGIGHVLRSESGVYIFSALAEIDGEYTESSYLSGQLESNTGGNIIYFTPSIWYSTQKLFLQIGLSIPIAQHWYGQQDKVNYYASAALGWTFW